MQTVGSRSGCHRGRLAREHQDQSYCGTDRSFEGETPSVTGGTPAPLHHNGTRQPEATYGIKAECEPLEIWNRRETRERSAIFFSCKGSTTKSIPTEIIGRSGSIRMIRSKARKSS